METRGIQKEPKSKGMLVFTIVWFGQLVSTLGSGLTSFALGVWVYQETGSATLFITNLLIWTLPNILLSPVAGVLSDRWDRRLVMIFSDTGAGISSFFVILMLLMGDLQIWHVYVATFFNSAFGTFQWPAYSAATSLLVPKEQLGRAGGMSQIGGAVSQLVAPGLAGALFVTVGLKFILLLDILSYLAALITLAGVRFPRPERSSAGESGQEGFWKEAIFGWKYIRGRQGLFSLLCIFACMNFLLNMTYPLLVPMLLDMTAADITGYVESIAGVGMLVGTLIMSTWGGPRRRIFGIFGAETLVGISMILLGLSTSIPLIATAGFFLALVLPISNGSSQAIWQTKVAPDIQGRVFAIRSMIAFSITPLAYLAAGPLVEKIFEPGMAVGGSLAQWLGPALGSGAGRGIGLMFIIAGLLYTLAAACTLLLPRVRRLEFEIPDALAE